MIVDKFEVHVETNMQHVLVSDTCQYKLSWELYLYRWLLNRI